MGSMLRLAAIVIALVVCVTPPASARSSTGAWQFSIAPYLWAAGMDGEVGVAELEADFDLPFSDIISDLDFALMGHFDMRNDRWLLMSDLVYVDLGQSEDIVRDMVTGTMNADVELTLFEIAGGYRVSSVFTLLAGARWVDMGARLRFTGDGVDDEAEAGKSWIDPRVGAQAFIPLSDKWWVGLLGDIGGFGVGSDLTWHEYVNLGYRVSHLVAITLGYQALDVDYEDGSGRSHVKLDVMISGPQLGVVFTF